MKYYQKIRRGEFGVDVLYTVGESETLYIIRDVRDSVVRHALGLDYHYLLSRNIKNQGLEYCIRMRESDYKNFKLFSD